MAGSKSVKAVADHVGGCVPESFSLAFFAGDFFFFELRLEFAVLGFFVIDCGVALCLVFHNYFLFLIGWAMDISILQNGIVKGIF